LYPIAFRLVRNYPFKSNKASDRQSAAEKSQLLENKGVTKNFSGAIPSIMPDDGELKRVLTAWPGLSKEKRKAIVKMIS
jgi:hypothetical protein